MKSKISVVLLAVLISAGVAAIYLSKERRSVPTVTPKETAAVATPSAATPAFRILQESHANELAAEVLRSSSPPEMIGPKPKKVPPGPRRRASTPSTWQNPEPEALEARIALSYVGRDELAEEVWAQAINDPSLPPHERQDLIEDLNETGFADPRNITLDDLPLILRRLALIEEVAPDSLDEVNAEAFAEAYKDLMNMVDRVAQQ